MFNASVTPKMKVLKPQAMPITMSKSLSQLRLRELTMLDVGHQQLDDRSRASLDSRRDELTDALNSSVLPSVQLAQIGEFEQGLLHQHFVPITFRGQQENMMGDTSLLIYGTLPL